MCHSRRQAPAALIISINHFLLVGWYRLPLFHSSLSIRSFVLHYILKIGYQYGHPTVYRRIYCPPGFQTSPLEAKLNLGKISSLKKRLESKSLILILILSIVSIADIFIIGPNVAPLSVLVLRSGSSLVALRSHHVTNTLT